MSPLAYLSLCSGIEACTVAWHPLGWRAVACSEIEAFPSAVLAHHYPDTPNWGDMTRFKEWSDATFDVLVGGTPCQSFSVAGLRKGLDDPRGNLMLTYLAIAARYRPQWLVWENVPGVLSSNGGRDFGALLGGLAKLRFGFAYRILDAQYFGLAQRRKRVFVVANSGSWRRAAAVLFEPESLSGHPAPRRAPGQSAAASLAASAGHHGYSSPRGDGSDNLIPDVAPTLPARSNSGGGMGTDFDCGGGLIAFDSRQDTVSSTDVFGALGSSSPQAQSIAYMSSRSNVRRLTPLECERLQGFPDDYTRIPMRNANGKKNGKWAKDGPRYKALGNSMAVPVMAWIGRRIATVQQVSNREASAA